MTVGVVATAGADEVVEYTEAAKQATRALDKAKAEADQTTEAYENAAKQRRIAKRRVAATAEEVEATEAALVAARARSEEMHDEADAAYDAAEALRRDAGIIDVTAQVTGVVSGESESTIVSVASGVVKAGLTGVLGPVLGLLKPANDAVTQHIDAAEQVHNEALDAEHEARLGQMEAIREHRAASIAVTEARAAHDEAASSLRKARKAEDKATKEQEQAAKDAKKAKSEAEEAKAAEKQAKEKQAKKEAEAAAAAERSASSQPTSRSSSRAETSGSTARPATGSITSRYGMRTHPITGVHKLHSGTDYGYGDGNAYAARGGNVSAVTYDSAYGNMVTLDHGNGTQTRYAHLARSTVSVGQQVSAGTVVGKIGSTGMSTGPHLHFEVLVNGDFVNPEGWLSN